MSLDIAANFVRGSVSAVGNITATTITYTLAGPTAFPTPDALFYNPDVGVNVTVWQSGSYNSPDLDPNAAIFRVTSQTSTVLTGYWTEGTAQPTAAGTYSVIMGATQKYRDDDAAGGYAIPNELFVTQECDFTAPGGQALGYTNATGLYALGAASLITNVAGESAWICSTGTTISTPIILGRYAGGFDNGQVLSANGGRFNHRVKFQLNPSSGGNTELIGVYGFVSSAASAPSASGGFRTTGTGTGLFFRVDDVTAGTTILQCVNKVGTLETVVNLTPSGGLNQIFTLEIIANTTSVQFYVNGVLSATNTTNIPTVALGWYTAAENLAGVAEGFTIYWMKMTRPR